MKKELILKGNPLRLASNKASMSLVTSIAVVSGLLELASVALVLLLMQSIAGQLSVAEVSSNFYYQIILLFFDFDQNLKPTQFIPVIIMVVVSANIIKVFSTWIQLRVSWEIQAKSSAKLLDDYMSLEYVDRVNESSAEVTSKIFNETEYVCSGFVQPLIKFISSLVVLLITFVGLVALLIESNLASVFGGSLALVLLIVLVIRPLIRRGKKRIGVTREKHSLLGSVVNGMEIIDQTGTADAFLSKFYNASRKFASIISLQGTIKVSPKPIIEILGLGVLGVFVVSQGDDMGRVGLTVGVIGAAAYRILPYAVVLLATLSDLAFYRSAYTRLVVSMEKSEVRSANPDVERVAKSDLDAECLIKISELVVDYRARSKGPDEKEIEDANGQLISFDFTIPNRRKIAIVGSSGAGKSTIARVLAGLQGADSGGIWFNKEVFSEDLIVRYVGPEPVFFGFGIFDNIGYSDYIYDKPVDRERAMTALTESGFGASELAKIFEATSDTSNLDDLSSGQRQRIAIARALYDKPNLLILDEALANLDDAALSTVFNSFSLRHKLYVLLVTHDRRPLSYCDETIDISHVQNILHST